MQIFILRHAERHKIETQDDVLNVDLTRKGKQTSFMLGRILRQTFEDRQIKIITSPLLRTYLTGGFLEFGYGRGLVEGPLKDETNTLCMYNINGKAHMESHHISNSEGYSKMIEMWKKGVWKNELFSPYEVAFVLETFIQSQLSPKIEALILITHDVIISAFAIMLNEYKYQIQKPDYLNGFYKISEESEKWEIFNPRLV